MRSCWSSGSASPPRSLDPPGGKIVGQDARPIEPEVDGSRIDRWHELNQGIRGGQIPLLPIDVKVNPSGIRHHGPETAKQREGHTRPGAAQIGNGSKRRLVGPHPEPDRRHKLLQKPTGHSQAAERDEERSGPGVGGGPTPPLLTRGETALHGTRDLPWCDFRFHAGEN